MAAKCRKIKEDGHRCKNGPVKGEKFCHKHLTWGGKVRTWARKNKGNILLTIGVGIFLMCCTLSVDSIWNKKSDETAKQRHNEVMDGIEKTKVAVNEGRDDLQNRYSAGYLALYTNGRKLQFIEDNTRHGLPPVDLNPNDVHVELTPEMVVITIDRLKIATHEFQNCKVSINKPLRVGKKSMGIMKVRGVRIVGEIIHIDDNGVGAVLGFETVAKKGAKKP